MARRTLVSALWFTSIFLAGDYLEFPNMEAAIGTGYEAADRALLQLPIAADAA